MKLFFHFAVMGFSNTYVIGPDEGGDAIIIDPGVLDIQLLKLIENNNFYIKNILLTHGHDAHIQGVKTLLKVYTKADIYSYSKRIYGFETNHIRGGMTLNLSDLNVDVIDVPGHSSDSLVYRIEDMLFTGDVLGAGVIGKTSNIYSRSMLINSIKEKLFSIEDDLYIFPGHGAPTTLNIEKATNVVLND